MNKVKSINNLVLSALLAAIICVTTAFLFHIPVGVNGGYVHLGDTFIYIAASILPLPYAMAAAAIGGAMADGLTGAAIWMIPTFIIKPILVLFFTSKSNKIICKRNIIAVFLAGFVGVFLYAIAEGIIFGNFLAALAGSLLGLVQPIGSGIVFIILGLALDGAKIKNKFPKVL